MTKAARTLAVRTPGAPAAEEGERTTPTAEQQAEMDREAAELEAQLQGEGAGDVVDAAPAAPGGVAPDLQAFIQAEIARGVASALAAQRAGQQVGSPAAELPDQSEIDPTTIRTEVLTKQGYVVPVKYPQGHVPQSLL